MSQTRSQMMTLSFISFSCGSVINSGPCDACYPRNSRRQNPRPRINPVQSSAMRLCPLYPQKRTFPEANTMSALCHKRTSWLSATCANYFKPVHLPRSRAGVPHQLNSFRARCCLNVGAAGECNYLLNELIEVDLSPCCQLMLEHRLDALDDVIGAKALFGHHL